MRYSPVDTDDATLPRAQANEARLLDAGVAALVEEGWSGCMPSPVGERAGLSRQPALHRYPDRVALATSVWEQRLADPACEALRLVVGAAQAPTPKARREQLAGALQAFLTPSDELRAAIELLIVSQFQPALHQSVAMTLGAKIADVCNAKTHGKQQSAVNAGLLAQAFGLLVLSGRSGLNKLDASVPARRFEHVLSHPGAPVAIPATSASHMYDTDIPFGTGDPIKDRLLNAVLQQVGRHGFDGVNVKAIAKAAGYTEGALWNRWPSKVALFHEATTLQQRIGIAANEDWLLAIAAKHGEPAAEAAAIREQMRPGRESLRAVYLEQMRVMWRDPDLAADVEREMARSLASTRLADAGTSATEHKTIVHCAWAMSYGVALLAALAPSTWQLPFVCITEPLSHDIL